MAGRQQLEANTLGDASGSFTKRQQNFTVRVEGEQTADEERSSFRQEVPEIVTTSSNRMSKSTQTRGS